MSSEGDKFRMRAALHNLPLVHDAYLIGVDYRRKAVGDDYGGTVLHKPFQRLLHQAFALRVESRRGLVEYEDSRILEYGTGDAYALALAS